MSVQFTSTSSIIIRSMFHDSKINTQVPKSNYSEE